MTTAISTQTERSLKRFVWEHPEWWVFVLAAAAWWVMLEHSVEHGAHLHHHLLPAPAEATHWVLMIAAMMLPVQLDSMRAVAFRSYRRLRFPVLVSFVLGYLAVWLVAGLPVIWLRGMWWTHSHWTSAFAFGVAALFAWTSLYTRALQWCHARRPLSPTGWRALSDSSRYGGLIGSACVVTCFPLMAACAFTGHSTVAMLGGAAIGVLQRFSFRPALSQVSFLAAALATWHVALALSS